jgi:hypothetical protein
MNLDTYGEAAALYIARGAEVNANRPLFTGDVFRDIIIPGLPAGLAMIVAHPCTFRRGAGELRERVLASVVGPMQREGPNAWARGLFDRMPLPDLDGNGMWAARFGDIGQAAISDLLAAERVACLSEIGINMLQQRLTCYFTRVEIPTQEFHRAFSHTLEEADLLEEWTDTLTINGWTQVGAAAEFESFIRSGDAPTLQDQLLDPQRRSHVRAICRERANRLISERPPS